MKKYKVYIPVILIALMFFALIFFQESMVKFVSDNRNKQLPVNAKGAIKDTITAKYNYLQNGQVYEYTFLEFGSKGCLSCKKMETVMEEVKKEYAGKVNVRFLNLAKKENQPWAEYFGVAMIPTQVILDKTGHEVFRHTGYISTEDLEKKFISNYKSAE